VPESFTLDSLPLAGLIVVASLTAFAQAPLPSSAFEAASIKPSGPGDARGATFQFTPGGGITVQNGALQGLIEMAYEVRDFQISGGPGWANTEGYDIYAKAPVDRPRTQAQARQRLQTLLADSHRAGDRRVEAPSAADLEPRGKRLKYYDLPELWKSQGYYTRAAGANCLFQAVPDCAKARQVMPTS